MKKLLILIIFTQGCTSYRIKSVKHENGVTYFFAQKRTLIGWDDIDVHTGNGTLDWATSVIDADKKHEVTTVKYLKYGRNK